LNILRFHIFTLYMLNWCVHICSIVSLHTWLCHCCHTLIMTQERS
jgi:hypothetical protein